MQAGGYSDFARAGAVALTTLALSACGEAEDDVRAQVARLLSPGDQVHFDSRLGCTAAVYEAVTAEVKSAVPLVSSVAEALHLIGQGRPVAFDNPDFSPNAISEEIMSKDLPAGIGVLSAGVGAKDCMTPEVQQAYYAALTRGDTILILDLENDALLLLDPVQRRIFLARGDV